MTNKVVGVKLETGAVVIGSYQDAIIRFANDEFPEPFQSAPKEPPTPNDEFPEPFRGADR